MVPLQWLVPERGGWRFAMEATMAPYVMTDGHHMMPWWHAISWVYPQTSLVSHIACASIRVYLYSFVRALCVEFVFVSSLQMHSHCSELHMDRAPMDPWFS